MNIQRRTKNIINKKIIYNKKNTKNLKILIKDLKEIEKYVKKYNWGFNMHNVFETDSEVKQFIELTWLEVEVLTPNSTMTMYYYSKEKNTKIILFFNYFESLLSNEYLEEQDRKEKAEYQRLKQKFNK